MSETNDDPDADVVIEAAVASLDQVRKTIEANPIAATTLALLLRGAAGRTIDDGLLAESAAYSMLQGSAEFARWRASRPANPVVDPDDVVVVTRTGNTLDVLLNFGTPKLGVKRVAR